MEIYIFLTKRKMAKVKAPEVCSYFRKLVFHRQYIQMKLPLRWYHVNINVLLNLISV